MDTQRIALLNGIVRTTFMMGRVAFTPGIMSLPDNTRSRVVEAVQKFKSFTEDNDPYGEHDFGAVEIDGHKVIWKIDYYKIDRDKRILNEGSDKPDDSNVTHRVLTIMLADEY